ncbi:MAG: ComEC/Rec2 family competence protein [Flavobacteriia bacterium]|nr:ComEC/Rec2 family competence protein [Flavobacteriia bacterium]
MTEYFNPSIEISFWLIWSVLTFLISLHFYKNKFQNGFVLVTLLLFFLIGMFSLSEIYFSNNKRNFDLNYLSGDSYLIQVKEVGNLENEWLKVIADIVVLKKKRDFITCKEKAVFFFQNCDQIEKGDEISLNANLQSIQNKGNPGEFDAEYFWKSKAISKIAFVSENNYFKIDNQIDWFTKWSLNAKNYLLKILNKNLQGEELAVAEALILGERTDLDSETISAFGNSGAMHVLAVSGLHIGILLEIIIRFLKLFSRFISKQKALVLALIIIWIYTILSGLSASVLRSTVMFTVLTLAQLSGRNYSSINNLFFTAFVLLLMNPLNLFDIGFQLSFLAMLGIFWFYKPISRSIFIRLKWLNKLWETTAVGLAAQVFTVPLTLYYFHQFPNYFILTNIALMFITGVILGFGLLVFAFSWAKWIGKWHVFILLLSLIFTIKTVHFIDELPGSVAMGFILDKWMLIVCFFLGISFFIFQSKRPIQIATMLISISLIALIEFGRFKQMNEDHICFFNHTKALLIVKKQQKLYCFYDSDKFDLNKIKRIAQSYQKIYPGNLRYFNIKNKDWKIKDFQLNIQVVNSRSGVQYEINRKNFFVLKTNFPHEQLNNEISMNMPWIKNDSKSRNLKNGAIIFPLN